MPVDSFKYLPRSIAAYYQTLRVERMYPIPWTPLSKPLNQCRLALVTTAGIYDKAREPPFDAGREKREPMWGDDLPAHPARSGAGPDWRFSSSHQQPGYSGGRKYRAAGKPVRGARRGGCDRLARRRELLPHGVPAE